jgi:hypothetical protein
MLRDGINLNGGYKLVLIILEYFGTKVIAVSVTHALVGNGYFHVFLPKN